MSNAISRIYNSLVSEKELKLDMMKEVKYFMDSGEEELLLRFNKNDQPQGIYDNFCMNKLRNYSVSSLSDIVNPFEPWFTLDVKRGKDVDREIIRDWAKKASADLLTFITDSDYYEQLIEDKRNFDLYGFSGLTITEGKGQNLRVYAEDPFDFHIYSDDEGVQGVFYVKTYNSFSMKEIFNYEDKEDEDQTLNYEVLCVVVPNTGKFISKNFEKDKGKYIQTFYIKSKKTKEEMDLEKQDISQSREEGTDFDKEIGKRRYFKHLPTCVVKDARGRRRPYGEGWGKFLLMIASNSNIIKRNMVKGSEFLGNPPFIVPGEYDTKERGLIAGRSYGLAAHGQKIEPIVLDVRLGDQAAILGNEQQQAQETIPSISLPQKKQRQSQEEIQKLLMEAAKNNYIYKMSYLKKGVSEHLKKIFRIAVAKGYIDDPPEQYSFDQIEPSLASLTDPEKKKTKAMAFAQAVNVLTPFLSIFQEGFDNFKFDEIIRTTVMGFTGGDGLEDMDVVREIRKKRQEQVEAEQQRQAGIADAQTRLANAQAAKEGSTALKQSVEAEETNLEGR